MSVEIKIIDPKLEQVELFPNYGTPDSAGFDLVASIQDKIEIAPFQVKLIPCGIALNMQTHPQDMVAFLLPRSGKGHKEGKVLGNLVGVIDQDYHGQLMVSLWNRNPEVYVTIEPYERFAQLVFLPIIKPLMRVVDEFSTGSKRGAGGFGSTG